MTPADIDFATALTHAAGWASESLDVFAAFLEHDPRGCFIAEAGGEKAGVCMATKYVKNGFIGELVVSKHMRVLGIGPMLFQKALDHLLAGQMENIYLDGDLNAVSYYESMGFRKICRSLRFRGKIKGKKHAHVRRLPAGRSRAAVRHWTANCSATTAAFSCAGARRTSPGLCLVSEKEGHLGGWIMARPGDGLLAVGPWAALARAGGCRAPCWNSWPTKTARRFSASASWKKT